MISYTATAMRCSHNCTTLYTANSVNQFKVQISQVYQIRWCKSQCLWPLLKTYSQLHKYQTMSQTYLNIYRRINTVPRMWGFSSYIHSHLILINNSNTKWLLLGENVIIHIIEDQHNWKSKNLLTICINYIYMVWPLVSMVIICLIKEPHDCMVQI